MTASPRIVTQDVVFQWDGVAARLPRGQVLDVPPGSALEAAIGRDRLAPLGATAAQPPAEEAPQEKPGAEEKPAPAKPKAAKAQDADGGDGKDGES